MNKCRLILLPLVLAIAACSPAPDDQAASASAASATPATVEPAEATAMPSAPQVEVAPTVLIHAEPAALPDCNGHAVTLTWNVAQAKPGVATVKIYTGSGQLFAHHGASGSVETGPWAKPGSVFVLRSGDDDSELERLTIGGPVCAGS